jgi:hypothetical protein
MCGCLTTGDAAGDHRSIRIDRPRDRRDRRTVGVAWETFLARCKSPVLHDKDKSHPTLAGSYLAACVFYAVLFTGSPLGLGAGVDGLSDQDAPLLRQAAQAAVENRSKL